MFEAAEGSDSESEDRKKGKGKVKKEDKKKKKRSRSNSSGTCTVESSDASEAGLSLADVTSLSLCDWVLNWLVYLLSIPIMCFFLICGCIFCQCKLWHDPWWFESNVCAPSPCQYVYANLLHGCRRMIKRRRKRRKGKVRAKKTGRKHKSKRTNVWQRKRRSSWRKKPKRKTKRLGKSCQRPKRPGCFCSTLGRCYTVQIISVIYWSFQFWNAWTTWL